MVNSLSLPEFRRPPVIETVLGLQFERLSGLRNAHLGAFWTRLESEWPLVSDAPPLEPQSEVFGLAARFVGVQQISITQDPLTRLQIRIVKTFKDMTSPMAHKYWELIDAR